MWCTTPVLFQPMCVWINQVSHIEAAMMALAMHIVAWFSMTFSVYSGADPAALFSAELCSKTSCTSISSVQKKIYIKSINFLKGSSRTPHGWWKKMQHRKQTVLQIAQPYLAVVCVWQREFTSVVRSILCSYSGPYSEVFVRQSQHNFFVAQQVTVVSW